MVISATPRDVADLLKFEALQVQSPVARSYRRHLDPHLISRPIKITDVQPKLAPVLGIWMFMVQTTRIHRNQVRMQQQSSGTQINSLSSKRNLK
jgi:hypothetical protein